MHTSNERSLWKCSLCRNESWHRPLSVCHLLLFRNVQKSFFLNKYFQGFTDLFLSSLYLDWSTKAFIRFRQTDFREESIEIRNVWLNLHFFICLPSSLYESCICFFVWNFESWKLQGIGISFESLSIRIRREVGHRWKKGKKTKQKCISCD